MVNKGALKDAYANFGEYYVSFIEGLIGLTLGFLGGTAVLGFTMPAESLDEVVEYVTPAPEGEPFVKVTL